VVEFSVSVEVCIVMPKYYCDYCDTYLTHDSPSVRKTHCGGRKHKENVCTYYEKWLADQVQKLVDDTTAAFKAGKIQSNPFSSGGGAPPGVGAMIPPPASLQNTGRGFPMAPNLRPMLPPVGKPVTSGTMIPPAHPMNTQMGVGPISGQMGGSVGPLRGPMGGPMGGPIGTQIMPGMRPLGNTIGGGPMGGGGPGGPMMMRPLGSMPGSMMGLQK